LKIIVGKNELITSIEKALTLVKDEHTVIYVKNGIYHEKVEILKSHVTIIGEDKENTVITYSDHARKKDDLGYTLETFRSYTVLVLANYVRFENITIRNDSGNGKDFGQAIALFVNADLFFMKNCNIVGYQDTLLTGPIPIDAKNQEHLTFNINHDANYRQVYENCKILGDVDFIFGSANAYFYHCHIVSINHSGYISAPSTLLKHLGHVFIECDLKSDHTDKTVYLGRPWRGHGYCAFLNCMMDHHIINEGFSKWNGTDRHLTARFYEYKNKGSGALRCREAISKSLTDTQAEQLYNNLFQLIIELNH